MKRSILTIIAAIGSAIANWLGGWDSALIVLVSLMAIDFVTGLMVAFIFKKSPKTDGGGVSSKASFKGLTKKVIVLILVGVATMLDSIMKIDYVRNLTIIFYIGSEGLSIIENTAIMGVPYPAFIKAALEAMKDKGDKGNEETK
jgi:toxin secretion/phage lysis holin